MKARKYQFGFPVRYRSQTGVALIEALVGMLIFAFGVLVLIGVQATLTRTQSDSKYRSDAASLAQEAVSLIWSDTSANYANYSGATACAAYVRCANWINKVVTTLPSGTATITVNNVRTAANGLVGATVQVQVRWNFASETQRTYLTQVEVQQ